MYDSEIKDLYQDAGAAHHDAHALLSKADRSADDEAQIDTLLGVCETKQTAARRLEKAALLEKAQRTPDPAARLPVGGAQAADTKDVADSDTARQMKAFRKGLVQGPQRLADAEIKGLVGFDNTAGGYLQGPQQFVQQLLQAVDNQTFIRAISTVLQLDKAVSLGVPTIATDVSDADWTSEIAAAAEDTLLTFGKRELKPSPLSKLVKISRPLMRHALLDPEKIVQTRLAYKFGITQEKAFLLGSGANQPLGVFTPSASGISVGRDVAAASASALVGDDFINMKGNLKPQYLNNAVWVFNRTVTTAARKLKTTQNEYIWQPGLQAGIPDQLLGHVIKQSEYAPGILTTGLYVAVLGNFKEGYWIAESMAMEIQVLDQLYALTNQMGYIGHAEIDGMPVLEEAFTRLRMA